MQKNNYTYNLLEKQKNKIRIDRFVAPIPIKPIPKLSDYESGIINRYFAIKKNEKLLIEISKSQYDLLIQKSNTGIDYNLYEPLTFKWKISGNRYDEYDKSGTIIVRHGVEDTNKRMIKNLAKDYPFITRHITNMLEFYIDFN